MIEANRHVLLRPLSWDAGEAKAAIDEIVSDALQRSTPSNSGRRIRARTAGPRLSTVDVF
jgi:hypothetical protein